MAHGARSGARIRRLIVVALLAAACRPAATGPTSTPSPVATVSASPSASAPATSSAPPTPAPVVLVGAGDIASCALTGDASTEAILATIPGTVFTLGDNAYESGTADEFARCYAPTWGRELARTRPAIGNHDAATAKGAAYFAFFGAAAGEPGRGYYSYDAGAWHVVVLNSECWMTACSAGSEQERWLRADLAAHPGRCMLAYWHHPYWSSGPHGNDATMRPFVDALYAAGADLILNGHDHDYERFAPQDPDGNATARGVREFVVGTGGASPYGFAIVRPNSEKRIANVFGVLKLTLSSSGYAWSFIDTAGTTRDEGSSPCHAGA
ncbi:MAG TPA: metallophosphoesterase [Candidatus Limnocylindria bacterium]